MRAVGQCGNLTAVSLRLEQIVELLPGLLGFIAAGRTFGAFWPPARCRIEVFAEIGNFFLYGCFRPVFEAAGGVSSIVMFAHTTAVQFVKTLAAGGLATQGQGFFAEAGATVEAVQIVQSSTSP